MYLTRILPERNKKTNDLTNGKYMENVVWSMYPHLDDERTHRLRLGILYRHEYVYLKQQGRQESFLVQSLFAPKVKDLAKGWSAKEPVDISDHINGISSGEVLRFRLTASPTFRSRMTKSIQPIADRESVSHWLLKRQNDMGVVIDEESLEIDFRPRIRCNSFSIATVQYNGFLLVEEREKIVGALVKGIGRGKSYGSGLMTVIRP